jgi:hypothetical protein
MKGNIRLPLMVSILVTVLLILGFGLHCFSQPAGEGRPRGSDAPVLGSDGSPQPFEKREKIRKRIELIRMWKLTEELDLTEETGAKLFPILHKYDEKWVKLKEEGRSIMKELRKALKDEATPDEEIEAAMEKVEKNALAASDVLRQRHEELKGVLSPRQRAKFIVFQRRFQREIRKIIAEARERKVRPRRNDRLRKD